MSALSSLWHCITSYLFPALEEELDPLTDKQREFVTVCELAQLDRHMGRYRWMGKGRKKKARVDLAKGASYHCCMVSSQISSQSLLRRANSRAIRCCSPGRVQNWPVRLNRS